MWFSKFWFSSFLQFKGSSDSPTRMRMKLKQICSTWVFIFFHNGNKFPCKWPGFMQLSDLKGSERISFMQKKGKKNHWSHHFKLCVCHRTQRVNFSIQAIFIIVYSIACRFLVSLEYILSFCWLASDRKMVRCAKLRADLLIICSGDN